MSNQGQLLKEQENNSKGRARPPQQASSRLQHHNETSYQNRQASPAQKRGGGTSPNRNPNLAALSGGSRAGTEKERPREKGDAGGQRRAAATQQSKPQDNHQDGHLQHGHQNKQSPHNNSNNGSNHNNNQSHHNPDTRMHQQSRSQSPRRHNPRAENTGNEKPALISTGQYQNQQKFEKRNNENATGAYYEGSRGGNPQKPQYQQQQQAREGVEGANFKRQKLIQIPSKTQNTSGGGQESYPSQQQQEDNRLRIKRENRFSEHQGLQKSGNVKQVGAANNTNDSQGQRQIVNPRSSPKYGRQNDHHANRSPPQHNRKSRSPSPPKPGNPQRRQGGGAAENQQHSQEGKAYSQGSRRSGSQGRYQAERRGGRQMATTGGGGYQDQGQQYGGSGDKMVGQQRGGNLPSKRQYQRDHQQQESDQAGDIPADPRPRHQLNRDQREQHSPQQDYRQPGGGAVKGGPGQGRRPNQVVPRSNRGGHGANEGIPSGQDPSFGKSHTVGKQQYYYQHGSGGSGKDFEFEADHDQYPPSRGHGGSKTQQKRDHGPNYQPPPSQGGGGHIYSSSRHQGNWQGGGGPAGGPKTRKQDGGHPHQSGYNRGGRGGFSRKDHQHK